MKKFTSLTIISICFTITAWSQELGYKTIDAGGEFQWYPAGYISTLHLAYNFRIHNAIQFRIGFNKANRKDLGKHDNEEGGGPGFSLGYRYYFLVRPHGFFLGARSDVWHLNIDWRQGITFGNSKVWVVQPTLEIGYMFLINDELFISPCIANGAEINVKTQGQPVGEGFITLVGISAGWKF